MNDRQSPRLFRLLPAFDYNSLIVRYPYQDDSAYAHAFHDAARRLAATFTGRAPDDLLLMPFLSLYRQAFELELKELVRYLAGLRRRYHGHQTPETERAIIDSYLKQHVGHNLHRLLNSVLAHYEALDLPEPFPGSLRELVILLHEADATGTAFRYSGQMADSQDSIDFHALAKRLDDEWWLLAAIWSWIEAMYDAMPDTEDYL